MPEKDDTKGDSGGGDKNKNHASRANLWRIAVIAGILLVALLFGSIFIPNLAERVKFFTVNALSLLVLVAIVVQAYIYRRQWEVMKAQAESMRDSLKETRSLVAQNERAVKAAERSSEIAQQNMIYAQRAYVTISKGHIHFQVGQTWFEFVVENSGQTPAKKVRLFTKTEVRDNPPGLMVIDEAPEETASRGLIGPGLFVQHFGDLLNLTLEQQQLIVAGNAKLYCSGFIAYQDVFGEARHTWFCFSQRSMDQSSFGPCRTGNEMD